MKQTNEMTDDELLAALTGPCDVNPQHGILVGVIYEAPTGQTWTKWKHVHSLARHKDGSIIIYANDANRTSECIPVRLFAGVRGLEL